MQKIISLFIIGIALLACTGKRESACLLKEIGRMPAIEEGYEQGVSACYAALYDGALYIAGGCNFPDKPAAEGGTKRYYKGIYRATLADTLVWEQIGTLPEASAYGVSVQENERWYIAGGINENSSLNTVFSIDISNGCKIDTLPALPYSIDNAAGCIANKVIYVAGGNVGGKASNRVYALDLSRANYWEMIDEIPSRARVQPVCASNNGNIFVWGGFAPNDSTEVAMVHTDGVCYNIKEKKWSHLPHIVVNGDTITVSGGTAANIDNSIIVAGGVNRHIFADAISGRYNIISKEEYMYQPTEWYSFNKYLFIYDANGEWHEKCCDDVFARAGAVIIGDDENIFYIGGELKPGIRTPQIHQYKD